jgi:hypothetical protein
MPLKQLATPAPIVDYGHPEGEFALTEPYFFGTSMAFVSGTYYGMRYVPAASRAITGIGFKVLTASGTDDPVEVVFHDGLTGTRLATSGSLQAAGITGGGLNSLGVKRVPITLTVETRRQYYVGIVATSTATVQGYGISTVNVSQLFGGALGQLGLVSAAAWGIGTATALTGLTGATVVPGLTVLK